MNVLFLTHRVPYAPNRGDRIRAWHLIRDMSRYADVSLFALSHSAAEAARIGDVPHVTTAATATRHRMAGYVRAAWHLAGATPVTHVLLDAPDARTKLEALVRERRPDVVLAFCSGMARFALEPPLEDIPFVLDMVDVDSLKWEALAAHTWPPLSWIYRREARTLGAFEGLASRRAKAVLVVNDRERDAVLERAPSAEVHVIPVGVDVETYAPPEAPASSLDVVFCGRMDYQPNIEGVSWFARSVWPRVHASRPDARLVIVGANPPAAITALADGTSIVVTGTVDRVQPYLWRAAVAVAPIRMSHGLQNKVMEALAAGLPVAITSPVADGLPAGIERGCRTADDPARFAEAVLELLGLPPEARRDLAGRADVERFDWSHQLAPVQRILEAARRRG